MGKIIRGLCSRIALNRPCRVLNADGRPYLERYFLAEALGCRAYLHRFVDGDYAEALHHHPWRLSLAFVLAGGYKEERLVGELSESQAIQEADLQLDRRYVSAGKFNWITSSTLHRIDSPSPETWTLFIHSSRKTRKWGQLRPSGSGQLKIYELGTLQASDWEKTSPLGRDHPGRLPINHFKTRKG